MDNQLIHINPATLKRTSKAIFQLTSDSFVYRISDDIIPHRIKVCKIADTKKIQYICKVILFIH
jgi:hypothetical protein